MREPQNLPPIIARDEWERARAELLVREKAHTRAGDALAAARRRLPMTQMEPVMVMGPDGPVHLHEVFEGRRMLNLAARDVLYAVFSSGPVNELVDYRDFMGWQTPWYSTADAGAVMTTRNGGDLRCYLRVDDQVFKTYETKWRGIEAMLPTLQLLDLTAFGRQETWEDSPAGWPQDEAGSWWERDGRPVAQWTRTNAPIK